MPTRTRPTWPCRTAVPMWVSPIRRWRGATVDLSKGQFKSTGTPFSTGPYGMIVAKNSGLAAPLLAAMKTLMADGQYKSILHKWGVQQGAVSTATRTKPATSGCGVAPATRQSLQLPDKASSFPTEPPATR